MNEADLDKLDQLERAATPAPWHSFIEGRDHTSGDSFIQTPGAAGPDIYVALLVANSHHPAAQADQDFIAAARNLVPALIAEIRRLRGF